MTLAEAGRAQHELEDDRAAGLWVRVDVPDNAFNVCADLGRRYGPKLGVRTLDSLHVACALELKAERFWTFDDRQLKLARAAALRLADQSFPPAVSRPSFNWLDKVGTDLFPGPVCLRPSRSMVAKAMRSHDSRAIERGR